MLWPLSMYFVAFCALLRLKIWPTLLLLPFSVTLKPLLQVLKLGLMAAHVVYVFLMKAKRHLVVLMIWSWTVEAYDLLRTQLFVYKKV